MKIKYFKSLKLFLGLSSAFITTASFAGGQISKFDDNQQGNIIEIKWDERLMPIEWGLSYSGYPGSSLSNEQIAFELSEAFATWEAVDSSFVHFSNIGELPVRKSKFDGKHVVTFTDQDVEFAPGVVGYATTFEFSEETVIDDANNDLDGDGTPDIPNGTYPAGTIFDGDIIFNSGLEYSISGENGTLDIRAIALHEIGHFIGLSHSSIDDSIMWPFLGSDIQKERIL